METQESPLSSPVWWRHRLPSNLTLVQITVSQGQQRQDPYRPSPCFWQLRALACYILTHQGHSMPNWPGCNSPAHGQLTYREQGSTGRPESYTSASWLMAKAAPSPSQSKKILERLWLQLETKHKTIKASSYFFARFFFLNRTRSCKAL